MRDEVIGRRRWRHKNRWDENRNGLVPLRLVPTFEVNRHKHNAIEWTTHANTIRPGRAWLPRVRDHNRLIPLALLIHRVDVRANAPL